MADYKPGTVAMVTIRRQHGMNLRDVLAFRTDNEGWRGVSKFWGDETGDVTDVRPLVVLDFALNDKDPHEVAVGVTSQLRRLSRPGSAWHKIADQIEEQTKPPRISEPEGMWAVVKTLDGHFVNVGPGWQSIETGEVHVWERLREPSLVREGVE